MAVCAVAVQNSSGAYILQLDPARTDLSTCPYIIEDGSSNAWRELGNLTLDDAAVISTYVGVVWAIAFGMRLILRAMRSDEAPTVS